MRNELKTTGFDYESVDKEVASKLQRLSEQIRKLLDKFGDVGEKIGEVVYCAHAELVGKGRDGKFKEWVESEGLELRHAYNLKNVWERSRKHEIISSLPPTVAYLISAPEVPEAAIKDFEKQVSKGLKPTVAAVKETIERHKEPASTSRSTTRANSGTQTAQVVAEPTVSVVDQSVDTASTNDDPIGDACQHEWDEDGDCKKCKAPGGPKPEPEVPAKQLLKDCLEHVRQAILLVDKISNSLGGGPNKRCRKHEYAMAGLDNAHKELKEWQRAVK